DRHPGVVAEGARRFLARRRLRSPSALHPPGLPEPDAPFLAGNRASLSSGHAFQPPPGQPDPLAGTAGGRRLAETPRGRAPAPDQHGARAVVLREGPLPQLSPHELRNALDRRDRSGVEDPGRPGEKTTVGNHGQPARRFPILPCPHPHPLPRAPPWRSPLPSSILSGAAPISASAWPSPPSPLS